MNITTNVFLSVLGPADSPSAEQVWVWPLGVTSLQIPGVWFVLGPVFWKQLVVRLSSLFWEGGAGSFLAHTCQSWGLQSAASCVFMPTCVFGRALVQWQALGRHWLWSWRGCWWRQGPHNCREKLGCFVGLGLDLLMRKWNARASVVPPSFDSNTRLLANYSQYLQDILPNLGIQNF